LGGAPADGSAGFASDGVGAPLGRLGRFVADLGGRHRLSRLRSRGGSTGRLRAARTGLSRRCRLRRVNGRLRRFGDRARCVVRVRRDRRRVLDLQAVRGGPRLSGGAGLGRLRVRRSRRWRRGRRVSRLGRRPARMRRGDHGGLPLGRRRRRDLLGLLAVEVLRPLVLDVDAEDIRTVLVLLGEGQGHERQILLLLGVGLLVDTRERVRDEVSQRPVDLRRCRLGPLVVQHVEDGVRHLRVVLVVAGVRVGDVEPLGVAGLVGQPHLEPVLGTRFVCELLHPGVGLGDGEVADLRVGERLDVGVAEHGVHTDLGDELLELGVLVRALERRRDAVAPPSLVLGVGHRVVVELVVGAALGRVREQLAGLDGQVLRVGVGCDGRSREARDNCRTHAEDHRRDGDGLQQAGALVRLEQHRDRGDAEEDACTDGSEPHPQDESREQEVHEEADGPPRTSEVVDEEGGSGTNEEGDPPRRTDRDLRGVAEPQ